jgi:hypothetical protein
MGAGSRLLVRDRDTLILAPCRQPGEEPVAVRIPLNLAVLAMTVLGLFY